MQAISEFINLMLDGRVSLISKLFFIALALVYIVLPIDLIPDFLLPLGIVDDGGVILAATVAFTRQARKQVADIEDNEAIAALGSDIVVMKPAELPPPTETSSDIAPAESVSPAPAPRPHYIVHSPRGSGSNRGCFALILLLLLSPFIGLAILTLSSGLALTSVIAPVIDFLDPPASANVVSSRTIVNSLRGLGQLVTVRGEFSKTDIEVSIHEGFLDSGYHSANHVALGSIEAGVDITQFERDDITYNSEDGGIILNLPAPIITSCNIEHIDQNEYSITVAQKDWDEVRQLAEYDAIMQFRQDALEGGILEEAKAEITHRLGSFINTLTGSPVHIEFEDSDEAMFGDTCLPDAPAGWEIDADTGEWVRAR